MRRCSGRGACGRRVVTIDDRRRRLLTFTARRRLPADRHVVDCDLEAVRGCRCVDSEIRPRLQHDRVARTHQTQRAVQLGPVSNGKGGRDIADPPDASISIVATAAEKVTACRSPVRIRTPPLPPVRGWKVRAEPFFSRNQDLELRIWSIRPWPRANRRRRRCRPRAAGRGRRRRTSLRG
jgi:hypothetical protein